MLRDNRAKLYGRFGVTLIFLRYVGLEGVSKMAGGAGAEEDCAVLEEVTEGSGSGLDGYRA